MRRFTTPQLNTYLLLADAITRARARGQVVACVDEPAVWDDDHTPVSLCRWCPVLDECRDYAATGAVRHGILAGRLMDAQPAGRGAKQAAA